MECENRIEDLYLDFLRYSLNDGMLLLSSSEKIDWMKMMEWAEQQAIIGLVYQGIQKGGKELEIPFNDLMEWVGYAQQIEVQNRLLNQRCVEIAAEFQKDGFGTCILKGQGNAAFYPNPLLRTPGDIDVWINDHANKEIIRYVKGRNPEGRVLYHHIDLEEYKGVEVEMHYRPSFMFNPVHNQRLQKWFRCHKEGTEIKDLPEDVGSIRVPNRDFNIVFQLSHVYNHLLHEGIGLRQIIDYYYLLRSMPDNTGKVNQGDSPSDPRKRSIIGTVPTDSLLRELGLEKIAGAVMWVLNEVLGLPEAYLIVPKDEKRGRVLLAEVMKGGNFGFYDAENQRANSAIERNFQRIKRDLRLVRYFPSECLWEPVFRGYHFFWRLAH